MDGTDEADTCDRDDVVVVSQDTSRKRTHSVYKIRRPTLEGTSRLQTLDRKYRDLSILLQRAHSVDH